MSVGPQPDLGGNLGTAPVCVNCGQAATAVAGPGMVYGQGSQTAPGATTTTVVASQAANGAPVVGA